MNGWFIFLEKKAPRLLGSRGAYDVNLFCFMENFVASFEAMKENKNIRKYKNKNGMIAKKGSLALLIIASERRHCTVFPIDVDLLNISVRPEKRRQSSGRSRSVHPLQYRPACNGST